jgi:hypothetical protein
MKNTHCIVPWGDPKTANQPGSKIAHNVPVQVGHDKHVKLSGVLRQLWRAGECEVVGALLRTNPYLEAGHIKQHGLELDLRVLAGNLNAAIQEQTVRHFPGRRDGRNEMN